MNFSAIIEMLKGKKTYILAFVMALLAFAHQMGWIGENEYVTLIGLIGGGAVATMRAGITKSGPPS